MNISVFNTETLYNATTALFAELGIKLNSNTAQNLGAKAVLAENFKDHEPFTNVTEAYFAGLVNDDIFKESLFGEQKISYSDAENISGNYNGLMLFALKLDKKPTRTEISELTRAFNQKSRAMPVALLFYYEKFISLALPERFLYKQSWRQGEKVGKTIILRDIDCENPHAGHLRILQDLTAGGIHNFNELHERWLQVLDVNILNRKFYAELSNWYFWALQNVRFPDDKEKNAEIRNSTNLIRLITRIIFIWFIKEKGLVPEKLFVRKEIANILKDFDNSENAHNYYNAILQNLFFGTLNQKMSDRRFISEKTFQGRNPDYNVTTVYRFPEMFMLDKENVIKLFSEIPFLNGGLFDCLDKEDENKNMVRIDGFTNNKDKRAIVPDFLFFGTEQEVDLNTIYDTKGKSYKAKGLINLLNSYKFTIAENTPQEEDVALDPELLGKVFENLLASYNPETQTTARKQTGSFYTPREIVNYMVDESINAYLKQTVGDDVQTGRAPSLPDETKQKIIHAIDKCKILDPACGSGAFPMGVLNKMVAILQTLDPQNRLWKQRQIDIASKIEDTETREQAIQNIEDAFENNELDYGRKLFLIENCIYGIDIQPIAVQIAKLRFFISLIIDQTVNPDKDNLGIRSLPNLETKFVAANTLIGLEKEQGGILFRTPEIENLENKIRQVRHDYFTANNRSKKLKLQAKDKDLRTKLANELKNLGYSTKNADNIAQLDLF
ncbi:MAG: N-6 DNA methylase, partial [Prevotellaceae bacterium]|nr:N-6 DNA methylase [Prevotellaceae bacterium]